MEEQKLTLTHEGESLSLILRDFRPTDARQVIECIRDEYGDTYLKRGFYDPAYLVAEHQAGRCRLLVAETKGEAVALLGLKRSLPREKICEWVAANVRHKYRHFGIISRLNDFATLQTKAMPDVSAVYAVMVTYHAFAQHSLESIGFVPCGFLPNYLALDRITHSYGASPNLKQADAIMVRPEKQKEAGRLYLPPEHEAWGQNLYAELQAGAEIVTVGAKLQGKSIIAAEDEGGQANCILWLEHSGEDLGEQVRQLMARLTDPLQTYNVFLNISEPQAIPAYLLLREMGYFFAGFRPLCGTREIMVLHHPGALPTDFDSLVLTPSMEKWREYVRTCYNKRNK
ncbi:MAG: hypothetical protein IJ849_07660 [Selenomonadaceae bacterium]|nr:hypothetical protein [Selenomonadaceae bacterium]